MDINELLAFLGSSTIVMAGITYLARKFIEKFLEGGIEKYKSSLQQDIELFKHTLNKESENLKHELNKISLEYQNKYNALYQERGTVIKQVYSGIINLEAELVKLTTMFQGPEWKETNNNFVIRDLIFQFENDFEIKRLYFSESTCKNIESLIERMKTINQNMYRAKLQEQENSEINRNGFVIPLQNINEPKKNWYLLEKEASSEIKKIRRELEREFARLIGVE
jgi:hypothetical protein